MKISNLSGFGLRRQTSAGADFHLEPVRRRRLWTTCASLAMTVGIVLLSGLGHSAAVDKAPKGEKKTADEGVKAPAEARPILAIWRDSVGMRPGAPFLRIAIWEDGRIVFAKDPKQWDHALLEGKLEPDRVAELKKAVEATGVFELKGTTYLVPDAPVDCVMLDLGAKKQILRWDERETPGYGINIDPKPQHLKFIICWKGLNALALAAIPKESKAYEAHFEKTPRSWLLKPAIQSE